MKKLYPIFATVSVVLALETFLPMRVLGETIPGVDAVAWQAELVKDINPGSETGIHDICVSPSKRIFLAASDGMYGKELWKTDGTAAGTTMVKDIKPGSGGGLGGSCHSAELHSALVFGAGDGVHGNELWTSDGTAAGTGLLKDIWGGEIGSSSRFYTEHRGAIYFSADDLTHGDELWKTDGTPAGTVLLKNINTHRDSPAHSEDGSKPASLLSYGPYLYFTADDHANGPELWRTDGTAAGTILLKVIDSTTNPSDLDPAYRQFITDLAPIGPLLFTVAHGNNLELWRTNGTPVGTEKIYAFPRYPLIEQRIAFKETIGGIVYFFVDDGNHGRELWRTDSSAIGTYMVRDLNPEGDAYDRSAITARIGSDMYVAANDGQCGWDGPNSFTVCELWKLDGTFAGTERVTYFGSGTEWIPPPVHPVALGEQLLFYRAGELWKIPTPGAEPELVYDFEPIVDPGGLGLGPSTKLKSDTVVGDKLILRVSWPIPDAVYPTDTSEELWLTDGTTEGTRRVFTSQDINPSEIYPRSLSEVVVGDTVYFEGESWVPSPSVRLGRELYALEVPLGNPQPTLDLGPDAASNEGASFTRVGYFRDWGTDSWSATVDYGDSSTTDALTLSENTFNLHHTYDDDGLYTAQVCITGGDGGSACSTINIVVDNVAPAGTLTAPTQVDEGSSFVLGMTSVLDPSLADTTAGFMYSFDCGDGSGYSSFRSADSVLCATGDDATLTVRSKIRDKDGGETESAATVTVANAAPVVAAITAPTEPQQVGTTITAMAQFTDPGLIDTHTATWDWGDGATSGTVTETGGSGSVVDTHTYASAGVYELSLTVTDDDGGVGTSVFQHVVIYEPSDGHATSSGWFESPEGAYIPDPSLTGKAVFNFMSKYKKGAIVPTGNTKFKFKTAGLNFTSLDYEWVVIEGARVQSKGKGTINGIGNFGFMLTAVDENLTPSTDVDLFRFKIWDKDNANAIVYDSGLGAPDDSNPVTMIEGGSIIIHKAKNK